MKKIVLKKNKNLFNADYYITRKENKNAIIVLVSNKKEINKAIASYLKPFYLNGLFIYTQEKVKKEIHLSNFDLKDIEEGISFLKTYSIDNIGLVCASVKTVIGLYAASIFKDIKYVLAFSPCDYVIEGTIKNKHQKIKEWPSNESLIKYNDELIPYHPYNLTKEEFWNLSNNKEFKEPHTLDVFNKSLENEIKDNEYIKVENINGPIMFFSSKDDSMWDSSKSVKRMVDRLKSNKCKYNYSSYEFDLGTHFLFPEPLIKKLGRFGGDLLTNQFISGRNNKKKVKETRIKIDEDIKIFFSKFVNTEK